MKSAPGTRRSTVVGVIILLCCASPRRAQEPSHSTFACTEDAVSIDINKEPALKLEPLDGRPSSALTAHEFTFDSSPFALVRVYLAATLNEESVEIY